MGVVPLMGIWLNWGKLLAVGVIAGQSIGEPGTELTLKTFHTGEVFTWGTYIYPLILLGYN
jgi:hypothetical protein